MIWLAWRQFRVQALIAAVALAVLAVILLITGFHLRDLYDASGVAACRARGGCAGLESQFLSHEKVVQELLGPLVLAVPVLLGAFWGAPLLARELETGTYRLAWTQGITRRRWLAGKLVVVGLSSIIVAELVSLLVSWWFAPVDKVRLDRFSPGVFSERGIVIIGYVAFALAVGVAAGALSRRTVVAMAITLVAFVGVRVAVTYGLRPHLGSPAQATQQLAFGTNADLELGPAATVLPRQPTIPNAWVHSARIVDAAGHTPTRNAFHEYLQQHCAAIALPGRSPGPSAFHACETLLTSRFHLAVSYEPAGKFWAFQSYETAVFLALAGVLIGACFWWLRPGRQAQEVDQRDDVDASTQDPTEALAEDRVITLSRRDRGAVRMNG
jgi:hypothetical protein